MAFQYSTRFREEARRRLFAGERVDVLTRELDVAAATFFRWKRQAMTDVGRRPGIKSYEPDELERSRRRIKDLGAELELVRAASALFKGEEVARPKGSARSFKARSKRTVHKEQHVG